MSYDVGDWRVATLAVDPHDGTTATTLTVTAPDGTTTTPATATGDTGATWTAAAYELTAPGEWLERWAVTGLGKTTERTQLLVAPDPATAPSGIRVYATTADYATWLHTAPPTGSRRALEAASRVVDEMLITAIYDVDDDDLPTDAAVAVAMRDATCAQAEYARAAGDPASVGAGAVSSFHIGSVSVTRGQPASVPTSPLPAHWAPAAHRILTAAALTGTEPWSY